MGDAAATPAVADIHHKLAKRYAHLSRGDGVDKASSRRTKRISV